jgi:hypothetical protein
VADEIATFLRLPDTVARGSGEIAAFIDAILKHDLEVESTGPNMSLALELFRKLERSASESAAALVTELHADWISEAGPARPPSYAGGK